MGNMTHRRADTIFLIFSKIRRCGGIEVSFRAMIDQGQSPPSVACEQSTLTTGSNAAFL
jgi:hypothetical protein